MMKKPSLLFLSWIALVSLGWAQPAAKTNLLQNGSFEIGEGERVSRWVFPPTPLKKLGADAAHLQRGLEKDAGGNSFLFIATTSPIKVHLWWQQEAEALGGSSYTLSVRVAADVPEPVSGKSYLSSDIGIYFLDAQGKWIGYQPLPPVREFSADWKTVTLKVTAPDDAVKIGVRLGVSTSAAMKVRFDDASLTLNP